ncbi:hypothetical protein B0H14DRAFT_3443916 [Mycena olivaceomarginata]|nr:hypothetical protein B0H14DRAFT_3443916 [Mycena olivaceomarginata]
MGASERERLPMVLTSASYPDRTLARPLRARLLPAATANASYSRVLAQVRPLQMQLMLRCPRCTPTPLRRPSTAANGGLHGLKACAINTRHLLAHSCGRGGLETRVDWISDTTVQVTTEKLEGRSGALRPTAGAPGPQRCAPRCVTVPLSTGWSTALAFCPRAPAPGARAGVQPRPLACAAVRTLVPRWPPSRFRRCYTEALPPARATPPLSHRPQ